MTNSQASPLMLSAKDDDLLGVANRSDAMGLLAVWSVRGRDLVPHLTEQTTELRGFQVLVEAFRLWELYEPTRPQHAGRQDDFFLLVEQAFGRVVGYHDKDWSLPGARRVRARSGQSPCISVADPDWHLLGSQKANGLWGLYRGAAHRAGILLPDMTRLSDETLAQATANAGIREAARQRLFEAIDRAMTGNRAELPIHGNDALVKDLYETFHKVPLAKHLYARLIDDCSLNRKLAGRLLRHDRLDQRGFLVEARQLFPEHEGAIHDVVRCENLIAVLENTFYWLCACRGKTVEHAVQDLPVDLDQLQAALAAFAHSGRYGDGTAASRQERIVLGLQTSSRPALAHSVLTLHKSVSDERKRAVWVWEDNGRLRSDVEIPRPTEGELQVGIAWRNDYYLSPLMSIAKQLAEVLG